MMPSITLTTRPNAGKALNGNSFATGFTAGDVALEKHMGNMVKPCRKISCAANCKHKTAACEMHARADNF